MDDLISKFGRFAIEAVSGAFIIALTLSLFSNMTIVNSEPFNIMERGTPVANVSYTPPTVTEDDFVVTNAILDRDVVFNWKDYVSVSTSNGLDIIDYVTMSGTVDTSVPGEYPVSFTLAFNGVVIVKETTFYVRE